MPQLLEGKLLPRLRLLLSAPVDPGSAEEHEENEAAEEAPEEVGRWAEDLVVVVRSTGAEAESVLAKEPQQQQLPWRPWQRPRASNELADLPFSPKRLQTKACRACCVSPSTHNLFDH